MYAAVDPEAPDLQRFPWWPDVLVRDEVIEPGELLVLPVGWWHHVRALDVSVSLAVNALRVPNRFDDYVPGSV
jgi:ribosomal protein L16 Arg81 hydroxylase